MTEEEKQSIISEILSAIRTNSLTIDDLTQLDTMPSDAYIEISGGRRISCETLKKAAASLFEEDIDLQNANIANINKAITDEAKRATQAELELERRLMGTSENSDAAKDPFKFLGEFKDITALVTELDKMTEPNKGYVGIFRATISLRVITIINNPISAGDNAYNQMIIGNFRIGDNGKLEVHGQSNNILYRVSYNSSWGDWQIANSTIIQGMIDGSSSAMRAELLERIQGTSTDSSPWGDSFKRLTDFSTFDALISELDKWHSETADSGKDFVGNFRTNVKGFPIEIFSSVIGYGDKDAEGDSSVWVQEIRGAIALDSGAINHLGEEGQYGYSDTKFVDDNGRTWYSRTYKQGVRTVSPTDSSNCIHTLKRVYNGSLSGWGNWIETDNPYISSPLYGKNVLILGGSFAHNMQAYISDANDGYGFVVEGRKYAMQNYIAKKLGLNRFDNFAVSGNGVCINNADFTCNVYDQLSAALQCAEDGGYRYDAIVFQGGINDYQGNSPLGTLTDSLGDDTFYASYKKIINLARTNDRSKNAKLFMTTPFKAFHKTECWKSTEQIVNGAGHRYYDYLQAIRDIAQYASIPLLDIWSIQQVDSNNYGRFYRNSADDNTHPNGQGYLQVAPSFIKFLAWGKGGVNVDIQSLIRPTFDGIKRTLEINNNPLGLSTTFGIEEFIAVYLQDGEAHKIGIRQITKDWGRIAIYDATMNLAITVNGGSEGSNPTGVKEYWASGGVKKTVDGVEKSFYAVYYVRVNWDIVKDVSWIKDVTQITEFFTLQPVPVALSVAGSSLLNMLQSLDYDIVGVTKSNDDGIAKELSVVWRDGTSGTVIYSDYRADVLEYGTLTVTYNSYVKVVQVREYSEMGDVIKRTTTIKYKYA